jgi:valyl-tRNA synthetase
MENIRDWCISRQLWWGHRIPVWYCQKCGELNVAVETPKACAKCGSADIQQDPDVLDTWFSSGLWPHSTLGWPKESEDLRYFYPTSVMETGYDILFFWVARMIMMGIENTGEVPFRTIYLHGLVRDEKGEKMSKMRGNVVNPYEVMKKYGTDALRFAVTTGTSPGNDVTLSPQRIEAGRNFANKIWNASRFILKTLESCPATEKGGIDWGRVRVLAALEGPNVQDAWIVSRLNKLVAGVDQLLGDYQFGEAERQIHDFFWGEFCDWYVELAKLRIRKGDMAPIPVLVIVLESSLRLLHPFMPFLTEEIWQGLKERLTDRQWPTSITIAPYPTANAAAIDDGAEQVMDVIIDVIRAIRNFRAQYKVAANRPAPAQVYAAEFLPVLMRHRETIETLASAQPLTIADRKERPKTEEKALVSILKGAEVVVPMTSFVDLAAERQRLQKEIEMNTQAMGRLRTILDDKAFLSQAPPEVVKKEQDKLTSCEDKLGRLKKELEQFE